MSARASMCACVYVYVFVRTPCSNKDLNSLTNTNTFKIKIIAANKIIVLNLLFYQHSENTLADKSYLFVVIKKAEFCSEKSEDRNAFCSLRK